MGPWAGWAKPLVWKVSSSSIWWSSPRCVPGRQEVVVAFDGEVARMRAPIDFRVLDKPLYLLQAHHTASTAEAAGGAP